MGVPANPSEPTVYIYIKRNKGGDTIANYVGNKLILTIPDKY